MHNILIDEIKNLPKAFKQHIQEIYKRFSNNKDVEGNDFTKLINSFPYIAVESDYITACFGADKSECNHKIILKDGFMYGWCIWDCFFITKIIDRLNDKEDIKIMGLLFHN